MNESTIRLPVFETIKSAWKKVKGSKSIIISIFIISCLVNQLGSFEYNLILKSNFKNDVLALAFDFCCYFILFIFSLCLSFSAIYIGIQQAQGLPIKFKMIKKGFNFRLLLKILVLFILIDIILFLSFTLFYVPTSIKETIDLSTVSDHLNNIIKLLSAFIYILAMILFLFYMFLLLRLSLAAPILIANNKISIWRAIKVSFKATHFNVWRLIALFIMNTLIYIISAIPLGIGLIWTVPYMFISYGMIYKKLIISRHDLGEINVN